MDQPNQSREVLDEWKTRANAEFFVYDGVIDEELYQKSQSRLMFLLKETPKDSSAGSQYSIAEAIEKRMKATGGPALHDMLLYLARWAYAIGAAAEGKPVDGFETIAGEGIRREERSRYFQAAAYVNVKKHDGLPESNEQDLSAVVRKYGDLLRRQIDEVVRPKVVLCGGTWPQYKELYGIDSSDDFGIDGYAGFKMVGHTVAGFRRLVIMCRHPTMTKNESGRAIHDWLVKGLTTPDVRSAIGLAPIAGSEGRKQ